MSDKINPPQESKHTYWYHPESDSVYISNDSSDEHSHEIEEPWYVHKLVEQIAADPEHKLPEGVTALIKGAVIWPGKKISGFIHYDIHKRFVDNYGINTSDIVGREPGGIYCTKNNKYLVEFAEDKDYEVKIDG